jgi:hypothetical protein
MGVVLQAEDVRLRRPAALKFLPPHLVADTRAKDRLLMEAQLPCTRSSTRNRASWEKSGMICRPSWTGSCEGLWPRTSSAAYQLPILWASCRLLSG